MKSAILSIALLSGITLGAAKLLDLDQLYGTQGIELFSEVYNKTMEWGTYKPNQFFAVKNRAPNPMTVAMLWAVPIPG